MLSSIGGRGVIEKGSYPAQRIPYLQFQHQPKPTQTTMTASAPTQDIPDPSIHISVNTLYKKAPIIPMKTTGSAAYQTRLRNLKAIGFNSYPEYLRSDLWATIRGRVFKEISDKCKACNAPATEVHHRDYKTHMLLGHYIGDLVPLCRTCHHHIEFNSDGTKVFTLEEVNRRLRKLLKSAFDSQEKPAESRVQKAHKELVKVSGMVTSLYCRLKKTEHGDSAKAIMQRINEAIRFMKS